MKVKSIFYLFITMMLCGACNKAVDIKVGKELKYCEAQASKTLKIAAPQNYMPNCIEKDSTNWHFTPAGSWTSGFWPGILWYLYEDTKDLAWKNAADNTTQLIVPFTKGAARSHDSGFITMCSLGNGYRLTGNPEYKEGLLRAADSLAVLYNPTVRTILSWPGMVAKMNWPHNTIIDNMMNLELLFWASKNGGSKQLYDIALKHAEVTMKNHFREDFSSYHVAVYDTIGGKFIKGVTHQGYNDQSMWSRGQAWAIYGYTMVYREAQDKKFLDFATKVADAYLSRLPKDNIPYWDFDAPNIPNEPKDASAAAITASALLELSTFLEGDKSVKYRSKAEMMLETLSSEAYQSRDKNSAFLLHSVGHMPKNKEIDVAISYADYYYIEALVRLKRLEKGMPVLNNL